MKALFENLRSPTAKKVQAKQRDQRVVKLAPKDPGLDDVVNMPQIDPNDHALVKNLKESVQLERATDYVKVCKNFNSAVTYILFLASGSDTYSHFLDQHVECVLILLPLFNYIR